VRHPDDREHSLLPALRDQLSHGVMTRREFIRLAVCLGIAAGSAYAMAGEPAPATNGNTMPFPAADPAAKHGGVLRVGQMVPRMVDPATYNWNEMSNQTRPILEYLTMVGPDNIVRPMLMESWTPSTDLKIWTLRVRSGVMWHNGEELTADHVAWNIRRWTDPSLGSSNLGLSTFAALTEYTDDKDAKGKAVRRPIANGVEVLDSRTLRLNLAKPVLSVAEDFAEYSAHIAHPSFTAPLSRKAIGTGPYMLAELRVAERCVLKRVTHTTDGNVFRYWGGDVYLDEIHFYHFEHENQTAAVASGSVDAIYELPLEELELAQSIPGARISSVDSAQTICCRMQVDAKPFDDIRVRRAIVKAADNAGIKRLVIGEHGSVASNFHVAPIHPEYVPQPALQRDVAGAKRLLKEAGYENGLDVTIAVGNNDGPWHQAVCEALRDQLKEAGINLAVNVMPATKFWEVWNKVPFGATSWGHRPLGTMALAQAYSTGSSWNESHFSDPAFDQALSDAEATFDVAARKAKMQIVERILQDAAVIVQPLWRPVFVLASSKVHGYRPHPARQMQLTKVWIA
jgi:peptide/nickel transport system substrate-binding protein